MEPATVFEAEAVTVPKTKPVLKVRAEIEMGLGIRLISRKKSFVLIVIYHN